MMKEQTVNDKLFGLSFFMLLLFNKNTFGPYTELFVMKIPAFSIRNKAIFLFRSRMHVL